MTKGGTTSLLAAPCLLRVPWLPLALAAVILCAVPGGCRKKDASPPPPAVKVISTPTGVEMVRLAGGEFLMGGDGDEDEGPTRKVRVDSFYMDRTEVTQKSYESLMGANPSRFKGPDRPVESLSWSAAAKYCNLRSMKEGLTPCYDPRTLACDFDANGYRLPTEAEWEYACRAGAGRHGDSTGASGRFSFGDDPAALGEYAWSKANADRTTHPVAQKKPNAWGLHDMHGNVAEWCQDFYSPKAYGLPDRENPRGPASGDKRVLRGGSWRDGSERCRCAARAAEAPGLADACFGYESYGFRCVRACRPPP